MRTHHEYASNDWAGDAYSAALLDKVEIVRRFEEHLGHNIVGPCVDLALQMLELIRP